MYTEKHLKDLRKGDLINGHERGCLEVIDARKDWRTGAPVVKLFVRLEGTYETWGPYSYPGKIFSVIIP